MISGSRNFLERLFGIRQIYLCKNVSEYLDAVGQGEIREKECYVFIQGNIRSINFSNVGMGFSSTERAGVTIEDKNENSVFASAYSATTGNMKADPVSRKGWDHLKNSEKGDKIIFRALRTRTPEDLTIEDIRNHKFEKEDPKELLYSMLHI